MSKLSTDGWICQGAGGVNTVEQMSLQIMVKL